MLSPCLAFALSIRTAAAIGCLTLVLDEGISHVLTKCWKPCFAKTKKNNQINTPPGWKWLERDLLSGYTGAIHMAVACISLVDGHPGAKRFETFNVVKLPVQPQDNMGSVLVKQAVGTQARRTVGGFRERVHLVWGNASEKPRLSFHLPVWGKMSLTAKWVN
jgi:hypothetical protein